MEARFAQSVARARRLWDLPPSSVELLERTDRACTELYVSEVEHYLERRYNERIPEVLRAHRLLGIPVRRRYGGEEADALTYALAMQRFGQVSMGVVTFVDVHSSLASLAIEQWGTEEQRTRYLVPATRGDMLLAYGLTEPEAGSDPAALRTTFEERGGHYVLNGAKYLISNGSIANAMIIFAYPRGRSEGMCAFVVDTASDGFEVSMTLSEKVGLFTSDTAMLELRDCVVPKENLLGAVGKGLHVAYSALVNGRIGIAAGCVGVLEDCLNAVVERASQRVQHGKLIGKHQLVQRHIAKIAMNLEMARWPVYWAAALKAELDHQPGNEELRREVDVQSALAKRVASWLACDGADHAVQVFGGFGYSILSVPGRHFCDTRVTRIYEGTDEIMELKIAAGMLGRDFEAYR